MNFMKGMLGTGILAIPAAFKYSGLWVRISLVLLLQLIAANQTAMYSLQYELDAGLDVIIPVLYNMCQFRIFVDSFILW